VAKVLAKAGLKTRPAGPREQGYDFLLDSGARKILIEVKAWTRPMPPSLIARTAQLLNAAVEQEGEAEGIIVTQTPVDISSLDLSATPIKIMTLRQLRNYLVHKAN